MYLTDNSDEQSVQIKDYININIMAKSQDAKKSSKKEPAKTAKEKKAEKREKKAKKY